MIQRAHRRLTRPRRRTCFGWAVLLAFYTGWAEADTKQQDAAVQQVLRKAQGMLRQLTQEKAALEAEKTALQERVQQLEGTTSQLDAAVKRLQPFQGEVDRQKALAEGLKTTVDGLQAQLAASRERERVLQRQLRDVGARAALVRQDNQLLVAAVKEREQWIGDCGTRNKSLVATNRELLEKFRDQGFWERLGQVEPFTGIGRVGAENAVEDYRYKLHQLKVTAFEPATKNANDGAAPPPPEEGASEDTADE